MNNFKRSPSDLTFLWDEGKRCFLALERPAPKNFALSPVTTIGLMIFEPARYLHGEKGAASFGGSISWVVSPHNDETFLAFLGQVTAVLDLHVAAASAATCVLCQHWQASRNTGY